jgi:hypothetical protein
LTCVEAESEPTATQLPRVAFAGVVTLGDGEWLACCSKLVGSKALLTPFDLFNSQFEWIVTFEGLTPPVINVRFCV